MSENTSIEREARNDGPVPLDDTIDPILRLMRENQLLAEELKTAHGRLAEQKKIYEELRIHAGQQLEAFGERVTLSEQRARRLAGQCTTLARCLGRLWASCELYKRNDRSTEDVNEFNAALKETTELLWAVPPEMK